MDITKEFLEAEIVKMRQQRDHAHDVAVASQAAIDVMMGLIARLAAEEPECPTFAGLGLPEPEPIASGERA